MSDLRSGGRKLSFDVLTTSASFFDSEIPPQNNRRKRKHKPSKKKKKNNPDHDHDNTFVINTNCTSGGATSSSVVYEEVVAAEDKRVISSVPELRQRTSFREDSMFRIDENVKDMDDDPSSTSRLSDTEKQTGAEMNGHCVGRMLEKDKSLDWRQLLPDDDPN
ncbi:hypothetical protein Tco_1471824, partial [Tanacetum coccineum]